jgi:hypothetical protein
MIDSEPAYNSSPRHSFRLGVRVSLGPGFKFQDAGPRQAVRVQSVSEGLVDKCPGRQSSMIRSHDPSHDSDPGPPARPPVGTEAFTLTDSAPDWASLPVPVSRAPPARARAADSLAGRLGVTGTSHESLRLAGFT